VPANANRKAVTAVRRDYFFHTGKMKIIALQHDDERLTAAE